MNILQFIGEHPIISMLLAFLAACTIESVFQSIASIFKK